MSLRTISLILNAILLCIIIYLTRSQGDSEALIRSEERRLALESQINVVQAERDSLMLIEDSLRVAVGLKQEQRTIIKYKYNEKYKDLVSLDADESISFLSRQLSKKDSSWN